MSNQGKRQASVRAVTETEFTYEGDWHALFDLASIPEGEFNGRLLAWLNLKMEADHNNLADAQAAFAVSQGVGSWNEIGDFDASTELE